MPEDLTPKSFKIIPAKDKITIPDEIQQSFGDSLGSWSAESDALSSGKIRLESTNERILIGDATSPTSGIGIFIGKDGSDYELRIGNPADKYLSYDGTDVNLVGSVSGRSTATLAGAIDSNGELITDSLNTATQKILSGFDFGTTDYAGAVKAGDITWNTTTGAITGGSGVVIYRGGIVGADAGVTKFTIPISGSPTFGGTLTAASGTFGTITSGTLDGTDVFANNFRWKKNTFQYLLGSADGWITSISGGGTLTHYASNQMSLSLASASDETSYIQTISEAILIGSATSQAVRWDYDPSLEFWAKINNAGAEPTIDVRLGPVNVDNVPFFGWKFLDDVTNGRVTTSYYDNSLHNGAYISGVNADQWHRYRIQVTKTGADAYTVKWYIDDVEKESHDIAVAIANPSYSFGIKLKNNATDISKTSNIVIAHAQFQQNYS